MTSEFVGIVEKGDQEARVFGYPTVNIRVKNNLEPGIYGGSVLVEDKVHKAAVIINPKRVGEFIEAYLNDFEGDLYGKSITINVEKFIRPWINFQSLEEGKEQIKKDIAQI